VVIGGTSLAWKKPLLWVDRQSAEQIIQSMALSGPRDSHGRVTLPPGFHLSLKSKEVWRWV